MRKRFLRAGAFLLAVGLLFALLEGTASTVLFCYTLFAHQPPALAERRHTRYDAELGWVNLPGVRLRDFYGPGLDLSTDAQGFRGPRDVAREVPAGKTRVICSGDSFTLGYGVGDEHTWCHDLETLDPGLESVNMGQGGYGLDQAYLWFRRDGAKLAHQVHVLAFITLDFERMGRSDLYGYPKPVLKLRGGSLAVANVPVPRASWIGPWLARNAPRMASLATVQVGRRLARVLTAGQVEDPGANGNLDLALAVFEQVRTLDRTSGSRLLLVNLANQEDLDDHALDGWRARLRAEIERRGFAYLDLVDDLRRLRPWEAAELFLTAEAVPYPFAPGHYSVRGNAWAAERIAGRLHSDPALAAGLAPASGARESAPASRRGDL